MAYFFELNFSFCLLFVLQIKIDAKKTVLSSLKNIKIVTTLANNYAAILFDVVNIL